jgi:hypothetical protein
MLIIGYVSLDLGTGESVRLEHDGARTAWPPWNSHDFAGAVAT